MLFSGHQLRTYPPVGGVRHTFFTWQVQDFVRPGTMLRLDTKVTGAGHAEKATRYFRAP